MGSAGMGVASSALPLTQGRRRTVMNPLAQEDIDLVRSQKKYVINISDQTFIVARTYGNYIVRGTEKKQRYTTLEVCGVVQVLEQGEDKASEFTTRVDKIGEDIAQEINGHMTVQGATETFLGVFISDTAKPNEETLGEHEARYMEFAEVVVGDGDRNYTDPKLHRNITEMHRRFAKLLNVRRPWLYVAEAQKSCPSCSTPIQQNLAKCPNCHAVLDEEKLKQFFPLEWKAIQDARASEPALVSTSKSRGKGKNNNKE